MKRLIKLAGIAIVVLLAAAGALVYFFDANQFRPRLERELARALGRDVKVGDLKLSLLSGNVAASDLSIAETPAYGTTPFVRAKALKIGVELKPLIFDHKVNVTGITVEQPEIDLIESASGDWNFSNIGAALGQTPAQAANAEKGKLDLAVKLVRIKGGRVTVKSPATSRVFENVNLEIRDFTTTAAVPFSLQAQTGGANIKLDGSAGPLPDKDASLTPVTAKLAATNVDLSSSGFVDKSTGIDGMVTLDGTMSSNGRSVETKGRIRAERLKLAKEGKPCRRPVEFDFILNHGLKSKSGTLSRGDIHIGKADANITGTYTAHGNVPSIDMKLHGSNMAIAELVEMLPPLGLVLPSGSSLQGGTATARLSLAGPVDRLIVEGPLSLNDTKLAGFDLGSKMKTVASIAGIKVGPDTDIKTLSASVKSGPDGTDVRNLLFDAPAIGELTGAGTIGPRHDLDFKMRVRMHTSGAVMEAIGQKGDTTVPFFVRGTSANPSFVPDVKSIATEKAESILKSDKVNKALESSEAGKAAKGLLEGLLGGKKKQ